MFAVLSFANWLSVSTACGKVSDPRCRKCTLEGPPTLPPSSDFKRLLESATTAEDVLSLAMQHLGSLTFPHTVLTLNKLALLKPANKTRHFLVSGAFFKVSSHLKDTFLVDEDPLPS
eukprot:NODE_3375_length_795_cov_1.077027.p1 GENE.NODE_3375_length_795_cov_1.077027~~NODE_3375_length_795_cov_1.077027.p1  ORF type:complete len:117 (-),score=32.27 NODE_3375_length_795_cov_1.077027:349-699(-)